MTALYVIVGIYLFFVIGINIFIAIEGKEKVVVNVKDRTPFVVDNRTEQSITFSTKIEFVNEGKQCATIMDAIVRPQLPFEQYDGIDARGKAEREGAPREDDYFEAYLVQGKGCKDNLDHAVIKAQIKLTARKGMTIKEAISKMPDFNFQIIWLQAGRRVIRYRQVRIDVPAEEVAKLAGTELVDA